MIGYDFMIYDYNPKEHVVIVLKVDFTEIGFLSKFYQNQNFLIKTHLPKFFSTKNLVTEIDFYY